MRHLVLINPNTDAAQTETMTRLAQESIGRHAAVTGLTAPFGQPLISHEAALDEAARALLASAPQIEQHAPLDGVIVSAFGDPALGELRKRLRVPVTGIAEAGMGAAARHGRFCVVTTTPALGAVITRSAYAYGHEKQFAGCYFTPGEPAALMRDADRLTEALRDACERAIAETGCAAIVIGGGPLATAARVLRDRIGAVLIEPVPEAARLALERCRSAPGDLPAEVRAE